MSTVRAWRFGNALARYDKDDEDKFRASVSQALQLVAGSFTVTGGSGALEVDNNGAIVAAGVNTLNLSNEFVAAVTQTVPTVVVGVSLATVQPNAHTWSATQTFNGSATSISVTNVAAFTGQVVMSSTADPTLLFSQGASSGATWIYATNTDGTARYRMQRNGQFIANIFEAFSGDVNSSTSKHRIDGPAGMAYFGGDPGGSDVLRVGGAAQVGRLGVGASAATGAGVLENASLATAYQDGFYAQHTASSAAVNRTTGFISYLSTAAASYTVAILSGFYAGDVNVKGAGSTITNQYGLYVESLTKGATNYAIFTNVAPVSLGDTLQLRSTGTGILFTAGSASTENTIFGTSTTGVQFRMLSRFTDDNVYIDAPLGFNFRVNANTSASLALAIGSDKLATFSYDVIVNVLGRFDSAGTRFGASGTGPVAFDVMSFDGAVSKWRPRFLQTQVSTGVLTAGANADGTFSVFAFDGRSLSGTSIAGPTPVVTAVYGGFIVDMGATPPANFAWDVEWTNSANANTGGPVRVTSQKMVFQFFSANSTVPFGTTATTFQFKVSQTGGTAAVYGALSTATAASTAAEVNAFGLIVASQIACVNLAAISADLGIAAAGVIADSVTVASQTAGIFIKSTAFESAIPSGWLYAINFSAVAPPSTVKVLLDMHTGLFSVKDNQGSPITRVKVGKVGSGTTDYGIQVYDSAAATIMDFTGAKRILAVPVQDAGSKSANFTVDFSTGLTQRVQLAASNLVVTFSNPTNGERERIWWQQDTTGSRNLPTHGDAVMWPSDTPPTLSTEPGVFDVIEYEYSSVPTPRYLGFVLAANVKLPTPVNQASAAQSFTTASQTHNVSMPGTVVAGELLLIIFGTNSTQGTTPASTPSGWTLIGSVNWFNQNVITVVGKVADGTEGGTTVNMSTSTSCRAESVYFRVSKWYGALAGVAISTGANGADVNPNPDSLTPGWTDRSLWIAVAGSDTNQGAPSVPASYAASGGGAETTTPFISVYTATRTLYAATEDPGTFTFTGSPHWGAFTLAVRPPA